MNYWISLYGYANIIIVVTFYVLAQTPERIHVLRVLSSRGILSLVFVNIT